MMSTRRPGGAALWPAAVLLVLFAFWLAPAAAAPASGDGAVLLPIADHEVGDPAAPRAPARSLPDWPKPLALIAVIAMLVFLFRRRRDLGEALADVDADSYRHGERRGWSFRRRFSGGGGSFGGGGATGRW